MGDGSFRMDEVKPGKYEMHITLLAPRNPIRAARPGYHRAQADFTKTFEVPEPAAGAAGTAPLDLGTFDLDGSSIMAKLHEDLK
jgi:hypothetical protein